MVAAVLVVCCFLMNFVCSYLLSTRVDRPQSGLAAMSLAAVKNTCQGMSHNMVEVLHIVIDRMVLVVITGIKGRLLLDD